jgi:hypothetical protein
VMFHLDYLSCFLAVLATILLAPKSWIGLSLLVCAIGLRTSQLGFISTSLFSICVYVFSMRSWLKKQIRTNRDRRNDRDSGSVADDLGSSMLCSIVPLLYTTGAQSGFVHTHFQR